MTTGAAAWPGFGNLGKEEKSVHSEGWPGQSSQSLNKVWRAEEGEEGMASGKRLSSNSYIKGD